MQIQDDKKLERAKKRIKDIKGFYSHLTIYILVNLFILFASTRFFSQFSIEGQEFWKYLSTPVFWGIGLLIHGLALYVPTFGFVKNWEERKMKELMDKDTDFNLKR
jgi:hypothetical protein